MLQLKETALSRIAKQYEESENFKLYLLALLDYAVQIEQVISSVELQLDIDIAEGINLDTIGEIVGISRIIPESVAFKFFGFDDSIPDGGIFGENGRRDIGARFRNEKELATGSSVLEDIEYRYLIRAKIVKNHSKGVGEDLIKGLRYIYQTDTVAVQDNYDMTFGIAIGKALTFAEKALLNVDILPRPAGVLLNQKLTFNPDNYFGFENMAGASGFDVGIFAEEF
jgi:Protein of unknown function (DUF2612)